jgi:lactate dehydrogenase-like 2-hydroxyacid dehydrogenase
MDAAVVCDLESVFFLGISESNLNLDPSDVFDTDPLPANHPFRSLQNLLATPHIGFVAEDLYRTFDGDAAAAIGAWIEKQPPNP